MRPIADPLKLKHCDVIHPFEPEELRRRQVHKRDVRGGAEQQPGVGGLGIDVLFRSN